MVTKSGKESTGTKRGRVKVPKLKLKKETVKDLSERDLKKIKGGLTTPVGGQGLKTVGSQANLVTQTANCKTI